MTEQEIAAISKALADPRRFSILTKIAGAGVLCCQTMRKEHPASSATISHIMKELGAAGLMEIVRDGEVAWVAGASKGIGAGIAVARAGAGYRRPFDIDALGPLPASQAASARFGDTGSIVNIGSAVSRPTPPGLVSYNPTRGTVDAGAA